MQVLQWALDHPDEIGNGDPRLRLGPPDRPEHRVLGGRARVDHERRALRRRRLLRHRRDPGVGLAVARMMAHITYVSEESLRDKFGRDRIGDSPTFDVDFEVESYLEHQGQSFLERFDANSYLYLTRVMDYFDPFADEEAAIAQLRRRRHPLPGRLVRHRLALPDRALGRDRARAAAGRCAVTQEEVGLAVGARLVPARGAALPRARRGAARAGARRDLTSLRDCRHDRRERAVVRGRDAGREGGREARELGDHDAGGRVDPEELPEDAATLDRAGLAAGDPPLRAVAALRELLREARPRISFGSAPARMPRPSRQSTPGARRRSRR